MLSRLLAALVALLMLLVVVGGRRRTEPSAPPAAADRPAAAPAAAVPAPRRPSRQQHPDVLSPTQQGTPTIDLLAVLTVRRRIAREGNRIYLDRGFAETDSSVVRWAAGRTIRVYFAPDTAWTAGHADALADARVGMQRWQGSGAAISFSETTDSTAEVQVRWVASLGGAGEAGSATIQREADGTITRGDITLALAARGATPLTSSERRATAAHEFGHILGLPHSDDPDDLMFRLGPVVDSPSRRDVATLVLLYAVPTGSLRLPPGVADQH